MMMVSWIRMRVNNQSNQLEGMKFCSYDFIYANEACEVYFIVQQRRRKCRELSRLPFRLSLGHTNNIEYKKGHEAYELLLYIIMCVRQFSSYVQKWLESKSF